MRKPNKLSLWGLIILLATIFGSCGSGSDWLAYRGKQGRGFTTTSIQPPIAVKWKHHLQPQAGSSLSFNPPVVLDDTIYFGSDDGNFYALDIESGYMRWVFPTDGPINSVPAVDENNVYFGSNDGSFYGVERKTGEFLWSFDTGRTVASSTVRYENSVIFTSDVGATYFFDPDGFEQFNIPNFTWLRHTFQMYDDVMYFAPGPAQNPRSLGAYDTVTKSYLWTLNTVGDNAVWYSFPALKGKYLFYGTAGFPSAPGDLTFYALDRQTGEILWENVDSSNIGIRTNVDTFRYFQNNLEVLDYMAPSLWKNLVIFTSGDTTVRAFSQNSGATAWEHVFQYPTSSPPTVAKDRIYFGVHGDNLSGLSNLDQIGYTAPKIVCLSARTGKTLWELEIEGSILSGPVIAGKWIIFGTDKNVFYVLEEVF
ncbi:MAG: PQQ-binding-like beta-propeller repeat protein [Spirochaetales bacterium]|nr:PQQ-binding-like beta-propeller repeat protein [Spirochaetales bacterium]